MECTFGAVGCLVLVWIGWKLVDYLYRSPKIGRYNERFIFITGCDTGFGHATAKKLDTMGCNVFAGCLTEKGETELKSASSNRLKTVRLNVTDASSVRKAYDFVKSHLPEGKGLWGIVNNAGVPGQLGPCEWLTIDDYKSCMDVNAWGVIDCSITFLPLIKKERGRVVNMASVMGRFSAPGIAPYSVSKYAVETFSDSLRRDMHDFEVGVSIIEPGFFRTSIVRVEELQKNVSRAWNRASSYVKEQYGEEFYETASKMIPETLNMVAKADISMVVNAYVHALTSVHPRARYVVGNDAKYFYLAVQALPEWLGDYVLGLLNKTKPKPAACLPKC